MICLHLLAKKGEHLRRFWKCRSKIAGRLNFDVGFHGYVVDVVGTPRFTPCEIGGKGNSQWVMKCPSRCRPLKKVSSPQKKNSAKCAMYLLAGVFLKLGPWFLLLVLGSRLELMLLADLRLAEYANMHTYNIAHIYIYSYISYSLICNET